MVGGSLWEKGWGVWSRGKRHRVGGVVTFCAENRGGPRRPAFCLGYTLPSFSQALGPISWAGDQCSLKTNHSMPSTFPDRQGGLEPQGSPEALH